MREKQREETRRRLYHAALEVFSRDGVAESRIEDIAARAEVSRAAFYFHFPSKDDVLVQLLLEAQVGFVEALHAVPESAPFTAVLEALNAHMAAFWSQGERGRLLVDVMAVSLRRVEAFHAREDELVRDVMGKRFELAASRGELSSLAPAGVLADMYLLNCSAAMAAWCVQPTTPLKAVLDGVLQLFMHGAGPRERAS
jgi:AcrR family transcriptional regulator